MELHTAGHRRGVVAAPHHAAAEAGRAIFAEGGNALEAMVAMAAAIAAVYPHMNHVGGDGFFLVRERSGRVRALMAAGRAGANARIELYREEGYDTIPPRGPLAALTAPAAVAGWSLALDVAKAAGGRMPLGTLLEAAIRYARDGYTVSASQARLTAEKLDELAGVPGFAATFLVDGKPPAAGAVLRQPALAASLDHLARAGLDDFYRGDVGHEIAADLERIGSPVTRADLEAVRAELAEPLTLAHRRRHDLQRAAADSRVWPRSSSSDCSTRLRVPTAEELRPRPRPHRSDQAGVPGPRSRSSPIPTVCRSRWRRFSSRSFSMPRWRRSIAARRRHGRLARDAGDTVWMGAADAGGLVVSYIQSIYWEFGSGCVLPRDRRADAEPRRELFARSARAQRSGAGPRCRSTRSIRRSRCCATAASSPTAPWAATASRRRRPRVFTRHVLYRQPLAEALDAPRWLLGRTWGSTHTNLRLEARLRRQSGRPADVGRPRRRGAGRSLFRHHGPCRRRHPASRRHAGRRPRPARRRRRGRGVASRMKIPSSIRLSPVPLKGEGRDGGRGRQGLRGQFAWWASGPPPQPSPFRETGQTEGTHRTKC